MGADDGAADDQTKASATGFGGEEGMEQPFGCLGGEAMAVIGDCYFHHAVAVQVGAENHFAVGTGNVDRGIDGVAHQVDEHLL